MSNPKSLQPKAQPAGAPVTSVKVLVVDDEDLARTLLEQVLSRVKVGRIAVFYAEDGEEALRIAQAERPDLILLDLLLPKMDGYEVCRRLQALPGYRPHIVVLTTQGQANDREAARALGVDRFIVKPFNPTRLIADLNALWADSGGGP
ncbi:MAG: response regulator transcription factor [Aggregatilineales bacterium]